MPHAQTMAEFLNRDPEQEACDLQTLYRDDVLELQRIADIDRRLTARMPGDDETDHPCYDTPNKFFGVGIGYARLNRVLIDGEVPDEDVAEAMQAIRYMADGQGYLGPGVVPEAIEFLQERPYDPRMPDDDCAVYDPSGSLTVQRIPFSKGVFRSDD